MAISRTMDSRMTLSGTVGTDPVLKAVGTGEVTNFRVAVNERVKDAAGQWSDGSTSWFDVAAWGELGRNVAASVRKGHRVVVHGEVSIREYPLKEGGTGRGVQVRASAVGHDLTFGTTSFLRAPRREAATAVQPAPAAAAPSVDRSAEWSPPGLPAVAAASAAGSTGAPAATAPFGSTSVALLDEPDGYDEPPF